MCLNPRVCGIFRKVVILETVNKGKYKLNILKFESSEYSEIFWNLVFQNTKFQTSLEGTREFENHYLAHLLK